MPRRPSEASNIYDIASTNILGRINDIRTLLEEEEWDTNTQRLHETLVSLRNKLLDMTDLLGDPPLPHPPNPVPAVDPVPEQQQRQRLSSKKAVYEYDIAEMHGYASSNPFGLDDVRNDHLLEASHLLYTPGNGNKMKRKSLDEINDLRMMVGLRGLAPLRSHDWSTLFHVRGVSFSIQVQEILTHDHPLSNLGRIIDLRRACNLRGTLEGFALDVLESLLTLVDTADFITRSNQNEGLNPYFEKALRQRWVLENPDKHTVDSCPIVKELTATTHFLNSYLFWGPVVVLSPAFYMGFYRSTTFSSRYRRPEIDIWVSLCDDKCDSIIDDRKKDDIRSLVRLMAVAFDDQVAQHVRALAVRLHAYDTQTRAKRFHGRDRPSSAIRAWRTLNAAPQDSDPE